MNTYTKLSNGDWGALCVTRPNVGDTIMVTPRGKPAKAEIVTEVYTRGDKFVAALARPGGGPCAECGKHSNNRQKRYDSSGLEGMCCERCARLPKYELSFG